MSQEFVNLQVGCLLNKKICQISNLKECDADLYEGILKDETKEIPCVITGRVLKKGEIPLSGKTTVSVDGSFAVRGGKPSLIVKTMEKTDACIEVIGEAFSEEKMEEYIDFIKKAGSKVRHPGYQELLKKCITEDVIKRLSKLPATLAQGGKFEGGALQQTVTVLKFISTVGCDYVRYGNENYTLNFNWDALITAALLQLYGNLKYYFFDEESGKVLKTDIGLNMGYLSTLELELWRIIMENKIPLSERDFSILSNIFGASARDGKNGVKAVSAEGVLLKCLNDTFTELDKYNSEYQRLTKINIGDHGENLPYLYSDRLDAYIVVGRKARKEGEE